MFTLAAMLQQSCWLNEPAYMNMEYMLVTAPMLQALRSWLNEPAT